MLLLHNITSIYMFFSHRVPSCLSGMKWFYGFNWCVVFVIGVLFGI